MQPSWLPITRAGKSLTLNPESRTSGVPFLELKFESHTQGFHQGPPSRLVLPGARGLIHENLSNPMSTHDASVIISSMGQGTAH